MSYRKPRRWRRNLPRQENESHSLKEYFSVIKTSSSLRKPPPKQELIAEIKKEEGCAVEEGSDDDVVLVENLSNADKRGGAQGSTAAARLGEEEELAITGTSGPVRILLVPRASERPPSSAEGDLPSCRYGTWTSLT